MNDELEKKLGTLKVRSLPPEWRGEILAEAHKRANADEGALRDRTLWWRLWLWPSPGAWAGLAAAWLVMGGVAGAMDERTGGFFAGERVVAMLVWTSERNRLGGVL